MKNIFYFGEKVQGYDFRVLNEREVRASAGILFLLAFFAFMMAIMMANFFWIKLFVVIFFIDFFIRLFINPKYAPSLILGRLAVFNQKPEYVGAPQKRFAWSIGLILALFMMLTLVLGFFTFLYVCWICLFCLIFLFFESVFGICIGCKLYNVFNKDKAQLCPGGVCEVAKKEEIQKVSFVQIIITIVFILFVTYLASTKLLASTSSIQSQAFCSGSSSADQSLPCFGNNTSNINIDSEQNISGNDCPALNFIKSTRP